MKTFLPTYLYVKTHNKTGLKYFGKTINDPYNYRGSGKYWLAHLKAHGNDVTTEVIGYYINGDECVKAATNFSIQNNIVESIDANNKKVWANQILENGVDGGDTGRTNYTPMSDSTKEKLSQSLRGRTAWNKGSKGLVKGNTMPRTEEQKQKLREANLGKKQSQETIEKRRAKLIGHSVSAETREKLSVANLGKKLSEKTKQKLRDRVVSEETKQKIKEKRKEQIFTNETKEKLKGKVVSVNKSGELKRIDKEIYYNQEGPKEDWEWVSHKSKEAGLRRG